ncbi:hypothetical protein Acr_08g0010250 [Actinidia rufa]|uniref:Uncharacterized protein n=1 Tax=Actinidia rufa TaxID=165716 RepID=A0A7J0F343_9ERIC|nr:hypothetical protein Acr_08g0010250 [Actinidia rufa]
MQGSKSGGITTSHLLVVAMGKASCSRVGSRRKMKAVALGIGVIAMAEEAAAACDGGCRRERGGVIASGGALL